MVSTTLVILTRNEISGLKSLLKKIPFEAVDECFAIDYKSIDGTLDFFKENNIKVIKQKTKGRGKAFKLAINKAKGKYVIFFSPDGNENPSDIPRIVDLLKKGNDLVIASRFLKNSRNEEDDQVLKFRKWANQAFTFLANTFWNGKLSDSINGYRGISKEAYKKLNLTASGFAIEYQMSIRALKKKMKIIEIPTIEGDRIGGESTSNAIPTGLKFVILIIKEILIGKNF